MAVQLLAEQVEVQVAGLDGFDRVVGVGQLPRAPVPHDHVAAAVLAGGDHALEVEVAERVVLDVDRHPLRRRVERRALRHRPAEQHAGRLEPQVVVEPSGPVALHHEPVARRSRRPGGLALTRRLGRDREVALATVRRQPVGGRRRWLLRRCTFERRSFRGGALDVGVRVGIVVLLRADVGVAMRVGYPDDSGRKPDLAS